MADDKKWTDNGLRIVKAGEGKPIKPKEEEPPVRDIQIDENAIAPAVPPKKPL